jgi:hypothetical protein
LPSARLKCWRWHVAWAVQLLPNPVLISDLRYDNMYTSYYSNCSPVQLISLFLKLVFRFLLYTYLIDKCSILRFQRWAIGRDGIIYSLVDH